MHGDTLCIVTNFSLLFGVIVKHSSQRSRIMCQAATHPEKTSALIAVIDGANSPRSVTATLLHNLPSGIYLGTVCVWSTLAQGAQSLRRSQNNQRKRHLGVGKVNCISVLFVIFSHRTESVLFIFLLFTAHLDLQHIPKITPIRVLCPCRNRN